MTGALPSIVHTRLLRFNQLIYLFIPLSKLADWAIYFTFRNFFLFLKLSKAISGSTGPIFTTFSPNGRYSECCQSGPVFPIPQVTLPWQSIFGKLGKMTFIEHFGVLKRIGISQSTSTLCTNFVNFGPVTPEIEV